MNKALTLVPLCSSPPVQMLSPQVPALVGYLGDQSLTEALLGALVDVSQASPSSLVSFLPTLRIVGQQCPALLGHVARIHGAVGVISEVHTHTENAQINTRICVHSSRGSTSAADEKAAESFSRIWSKVNEF